MRNIINKQYPYFQGNTFNVEHYFFYCNSSVLLFVDKSLVIQHFMNPRRLLPDNFFE